MAWPNPYCKSFIIDFNVEDFESGKNQSQKNFTDVQTEDPLKRNFHNDKDSITGGNIALELNEEVEICNHILSWGEDLIEIPTGKVNANRSKTEFDIGNSQAFSGGDLFEILSRKAI